MSPRRPRGRASASTGPTCATPSTTSVIAELTQTFAELRRRCLAALHRARRPRQGLLRRRRPELDAAPWPATAGTRTAPTRRRWPTCCGRSTAARCRWSGASRATAMPAAGPGGGVRRAGRGRGRALLPQRSAPGPVAGHHQPVCGARDGRAGLATLLRHRRALRRGAGACAGLRARMVCAAEALDAKVDELVATLVANGPKAVRACKTPGAATSAAGTIDGRSARRHRAPHRRHPRQRRRPRRRPVLPAEAPARRGRAEPCRTSAGRHATCWVTIGSRRPTARRGRRARLGQRPAPVCVVFLTGAAGCVRLGRAARRPARAAAPGDAGGQRLHAVRRVLRRQDSGRRHAVGPGAHADAHSRRRGAGGRGVRRRPAPPGDCWPRCWAARSPPPATWPRRPRARPSTPRPSRFPTSGHVAGRQTAWCPALLWLAWHAPGGVRRAAAGGGRVVVCDRRLDRRVRQVPAARVLRRASGWLRVCQLSE